MNVPHPFNLGETYLDSPLAHRPCERNSRMKGHNLVIRAVNQERWRGVAPIAKMCRRRNRSDEMCRRRRGPGFVAGRANAVEQERKAVTFLEQGEDQLGARVTGADPAEVAAVAYGGVAGSVRCDL